MIRIKSRLMVLAEHIAHGTDKKCIQNFVRPPSEKLPIGRCKHKRQNTIKGNLRKKCMMVPTGFISLHIGTSCKA
jgi:hypothetical protein